MAFCANCWVLREGVGVLNGSLLDPRYRKSGSGSRSHIQFVLTENSNLFFRTPHSSTKTRPSPSPVKCEKSNRQRRQFDPSKVKKPPYHVYMDSTSGQLEPASGSRASIPPQEFWPEGTREQVRAAQAPAPMGLSEGSPSYGKSPGSRRSKRFKNQVKTSDSSDSLDSLEPSESSGSSEESGVTEMRQSVENGGGKEEYVVYKEEKEELTGYDLDKEIGNPHPFINPETARTLENIRTSDDLWWNWRRSERWSRWQRRKPDVDRVFTKAMAETGQIKIFGDEPTVTEAALAKARKEVYKEERLKAEEDRLSEIGPIAYYSEWVSAYKDVDTSREAVQRRYEETGKDENEQLIEMFCHQTAEEYQIMAGRDPRINRDPLAMRMREELIREIWGGDPVYPTVNYIRDPKEVVDYRSPEFHEPIPSPTRFLLEHRFMIPADEFEQMIAHEKEPEIEEMTEVDKAMSTAIDIGDIDDNEEEEAKEEEDEEQEFKDVADTWNLDFKKPNEKAKKGKNLAALLMDSDEEEEEENDDEE